MLSTSSPAHDNYYYYYYYDYYYLCFLPRVSQGESEVSRSESEVREKREVGRR